MSSAHKRILVRQAKEWGEILLGIETRNRYELFDEHNQRFGFAAEESGGAGRVFGRLFLGSSRKATIHVHDESGKLLMRAEKPFRWFFHRMEVHVDGRMVGSVQRRWSWFHRRFTIENAAGEAVLEIDSPWLRIWTFTIKFGGREIGEIRKKWGGIGRELFTDADTFGIQYDALPDLEPLRPLLIAAVFLIDFTCFENNSGSSGLAGAFTDT